MPLKDIGQIIILGGNQPNGKYFCNGLTEIFLKEQANLKKPDPKTFLRVGKNMPDSLLKLAVSCLTAKTEAHCFQMMRLLFLLLKDLECRMRTPTRIAFQLVGNHIS